MIFDSITNTRNNGNMDMIDKTVSMVRGQIQFEKCSVLVRFMIHAKWWIEDVQEWPQIPQLLMEQIFHGFSEFGKIT